MPRPALRLSPIGRNGMFGLVLLAIAGLLTGVGLLTGDLLSRSMRLQDRLDLARERIFGIGRLRMDLDEAETGQRGYLLTGSPAYLAPYERAVRRLDEDFARLAQLARNDPQAEVGAAQVRALAEGMLTELRQTLDLAQRGDTRAAMAIVMAGRGERAQEELRERAGALLEAARAERARLEAELAAVRSDLLTLLMLATGAGFGLAGLTVLGLLVSRARLKASQARLREETARLVAAAAIVRPGIGIFDRAGRLRIKNERLASRLGIDGASVRQGMNFAELVELTEGWQPPVLARPPPTTETGPVAAEMRKDGRVVEVWRGLMPDGGQMLVVADITARLDMERLARDAQKLDALGRLTGGVAHDFNNLLQAVQANLELLERQVDQTSPLRSRLAAALGGVQRGARLTRSLLAFARRQRLTPVPVDVQNLVGQLMQMLRDTLPATIELVFLKAPELWPVQADPEQLESALLNLVLNARDAMPSGGQIVVEATNLAVLAPRQIGADTLPRGEYVGITIRDSGIGMTEEQLVRAVEPFFSTKGVRGSGLGLSMVHGFARQSRGGLDLESAPGAGTTARLYLPRARSAPEAPMGEPAADLPLGRGESVLVVEDDPAVLGAIVAALHDLGYGTMTAENGAAALAILQSGARPDLLLSDVVMPGPVGAVEMAERARRIVGPGLPVVFTSGYAEDALVAAGGLPPGARLLAKPWRMDELARRLRQALSPNLSRRLRVVLAEDDGLLRGVVAEILAADGHEVRAAGSAGEALRLLDGGADVLIADLSLPDMDGAHLAEQARQASPGLRVIIATGHGRDLSSLALPHVRLDKPFTAVRLRDALAEAMA